MKFSKRFVRWFLRGFLTLIVINLAMFRFQTMEWWILSITGTATLFLVFLFLRKLNFKSFSATTKYKKWVEHKELISRVVSYLFQYSLLIFLILLLVNQFYQVSFININYFMVVVILLGILAVIIPYKEKRVTTKIDSRIMYIIALGGGVFVFLKTRSIGWLSFVVSIVAVILIILLGTIIKEEDSDIRSELED